MIDGNVNKSGTLFSDGYSMSNENPTDWHAESLRQSHAFSRLQHLYECVYSDNVHVINEILHFSSFSVICFCIVIITNNE